MKKALLSFNVSYPTKMSAMPLVAGIFILAFSITFSKPTCAQKSFEDIAEMKDKQWDKLVKSHKDGLNHIYAVEGVQGAGLLEEDYTPNPKKIGIITFQLWDEVTYSSTKAGDWVYYESKFLTPDGSNVISNELVSQMLPVVQTKFNAEGYELLEPSEFLDSEEKRELYTRAPEEIELSGIIKFANNGFLRRLQGDTETGQGSVSADGYAFYPIAPSVLSSDFKAPAALGKLAEDLGLDAVLIISVTVSVAKNGKEIVFKGLETGLYGPIYDDESIEYSGVIGAKTVNIYRDGVMFSTAFFEVDPFVMADMDKKSGNITAYYTDGLATVTERLTGELIFGLEKYKALDKSNKRL